MGRDGPGARDGAALLEQVKEIKKAVTSVPILSNGNIRWVGDKCMLIQYEIIFICWEGVF